MHVKNGDGQTDGRTDGRTNGKLNSRSRILAIKKLTIALPHPLDKCDVGCKKEILVPVIFKRFCKQKTAAAQRGRILFTKTFENLLFIKMHKELPPCLLFGI